MHPSREPDRERWEYMRQFEAILNSNKPYSGEHMIVFGTLRGDRIEWSHCLFEDSSLTEL